MPAGTGAGIGFVCLGLIGVLLLLDRRANETLPGILAFATAVSGLIWQGTRWHALWKASCTEKEKAQLRLKHQEERHTRQEIERHETARKKQETSYARQRAREAAEARRLSHRKQEVEQAARRQARHDAEAQEVQRILSLPDDQLLPLFASVFEREGLHSELIQEEAHCDMLLTDDDGRTIAVVRRVPCSRKAEASDVRALEAWRFEQRAQRAYLVALAGFSPSAVREASKLPMSLVEAFLLAHWSVQEGRLFHDA